MPLALRIIKQAKWYKDEVRPWLDRGLVPADLLGDLATKSNALSVYLTEGDEAELEHIIAALAAEREKLENFDYLLFDVNILQDCDIKVEESLGGTSDGEVNQQHCDLVELSGQQILQLAQGILNSTYQTDRVNWKDVRQLVLDAVKSGRIPVTSLKQKLREAVEGALGN